MGAHDTLLDRRTNLQPSNSTFEIGAENLQTDNPPTEKEIVSSSTVALGIGRPCVLLDG